MNRVVDVKQIEFALVAKNYGINALDLESLKEKNIVPTDWELAQPATRKGDMVLMTLQNGIHILQQNNLCAFLENIGAKELESLETPQAVQKYIEQSSQLSFQGIRITVEGYVSCNSHDEARNYLLTTLLNSNNQHESDQGLVQASANFIYKLDTGLLFLSVTNSGLELLEGETIPLILFSANFQHDMAEVPTEAQHHTLAEIVSDWQSHVEIYRTIVNEKFLTGKAEKVFQ